MSNQEANAGGCSASVEQPDALKAFLAAMSAARRQASMYGDDHPNSKSALADVSERIVEFADTYGRATCTFTHDAVVVNQHYYAASRDSVELCERLRARGAMAFTIVSEPSPQHLKEFLAFLNAEPRKVRLRGGPSNYLRARGVSEVVLVESTYASGEGGAYSGASQRAEWKNADDDEVIRAIIGWLAKQEADREPPSPKLPITRILSDPDSAARLITEAVTKLHASRTDMTQGECVSEAINDLRTIASDTPEEWDKAAPGIRKALAKLPNGMQFSTVGFALKSVQTDGHDADVELAENLVHQVLGRIAADPDRSHVPPPDVFEQFFGAKAPGLLSTWKCELQPTSVLESTGRTLETLLTWETNACEHGRIASALAALIARALEIDNTHCVLLFTEWLLDDALRDTQLGWRRTNVRAALESLGEQELAHVMETLVAMNKPHAHEAASGLLEVVPRVALSLIGQWADPVMQVLSPALKIAAIELGSEAWPMLARLLRDTSTSGFTIALDILTETGGTWAAGEIVDAMRRGHTEFILAAMDVLPRIRVPLVTQTCLGLLRHGEQRIRLAALTALARMKDPTAVPDVARIAARYSPFRRQATDEPIAALRTLAAIGGLQAADCLKTIAERRPLLGRSRYQPIRREAQRLLDRPEDRLRAA